MDAFSVLSWWKNEWNPHFWPLQKYQQCEMEFSNIFLLQERGLDYKLAKFQAIRCIQSGAMNFWMCPLCGWKKWRAISWNRSNSNSIQQMWMNFSNLLDIRLGNLLVRYRVAKRAKRKPIAAKNERKTADRCTGTACDWTTANWWVFVASSCHLSPLYTIILAVLLSNHSDWFRLWFNFKKNDFRRNKSSAYQQHQMLDSFWTIFS